MSNDPTDHRPIATLVKNTGLGVSTIRRYMREARDSSDPKMQRFVQKVFDDEKQKTYHWEVSEGWILQKSQQLNPWRGQGSVSDEPLPKHMQDMLDEKDKRIEGLENDKKHMIGQLAMKDEQLKETTQAMRAAQLFALQKRQGVFSRLFGGRIPQQIELVGEGSARFQ